MEATVNLHPTHGSGSTRSASVTVPKGNHPASQWNDCLKKQPKNPVPVLTQNPVLTLLWPPAGQQKHGPASWPVNHSSV